jgi:ketosteroid isomerase-like protein
LQGAAAILALVDDGAISKTRATFVAALRDGDAAAASAIYADDAKLLAPSAELVQGRDAIEAFWRAGVDAGLRDVELEALELDVQGRLAYEIGCYALRLEPADGQPVVDRGKYLLVHERQQDGSWRWAVEMFNPDMPPAVAGGHSKQGRRRDVQARVEG